MRLIDADELLEHVWRDRLDSRELISEMITSAPTIRAMTAYDICPYCKYRNRNCQFGTSECRFAEEDDDDKYAEQEPCDDAISRQAAILLASIATMSIDETVKAIKRLPSVRPQEQTGHWKSTIDGKPICSECGFVSESEDGYFVSHFCPNCGAKMESEV